MNRKCCNAKLLIKIYSLQIILSLSLTASRYFLFSLYNGCFQKKCNFLKSDTANIFISNSIVKGFPFSFFPALTSRSDERKNGNPIRFMDHDEQKGRKEREFNSILTERQFVDLRNSFFTLFTVMSEHVI